MISPAGGQFDARGQPLFFIASNTDRGQWGATAHDCLLVPVDEFTTARSQATLGEWLAGGKRILLDSGVYALAMRYARQHAVPLPQALGMNPEDVDGWGELFEIYVEIVRKYGDRSWGYMELDLGGRPNKIKTRAKLEALGLRPIPIYHPLVDGWEYFDELAQRYDRIGIGNVVDAMPSVRKRLMATIWQRRTRYPGLWLHLLGLTPNQYVHAYPFNSADSSSWLATVRFGRFEEICNGKLFSNVEMRYERASDPGSAGGNRKMVILAAFREAMVQRNWRHYLGAMQAQGCEFWPASAPAAIRGGPGV